MSYNPRMMKQHSVILHTIFVLLTVVFLTACGGGQAPAPALQEEPAPIQAETVQQARDLVDRFRSTLKAALMEGLADGPSQAMGACSIQAPELAAQLSMNGVRIGRTSRHLRNPANAPAAWMVPLLEEYAGSESGTEPRAVRIDATTIGYVDPLYVGKPCLACHGAEITEAVQSEIAELYPQDQATGLVEGSFRGLVWVEILSVPKTPSGR